VALGVEDDGCAAVEDDAVETEDDGWPEAEGVVCWSDVADNFVPSSEPSDTKAGED
jgi:hypothetical protein